MTAKFLPLNIRIRVMDPMDAKGRTTIMCAIPSPNNPRNAVMSQPGVLEIALIDPDNGQEKWYEVPFIMNERSVIFVDKGKMDG